MRYIYAIAIVFIVVMACYSVVSMFIGAIENIPMVVDMLG